MNEEPEVLDFGRIRNNDVKQEQTVEECIQELENYQKLLIEKGAVPGLGEPLDSTSLENLSYWDIQKRIEEITVSIIDKDSVQKLYNDAEILIHNLKNRDKMQPVE